MWNSKIKELRLDLEIATVYLAYAMVYLNMIGSYLSTNQGHILEILSIFYLGFISHEIKSKDFTTLIIFAL